MQSEYKILTHLKENEKTSQRNKSHSNDLSLGAVNILTIVSFAKALSKLKNLIPATCVTSSPQRIKEKTRFTYQFIRSPYQQILNITNVIEELCAEEQSKNPQIM